MYSSAEVAARSRLRLPEGYTATPAKKSPNEIDYEISVPADALHGDYANLALEADGVALGRARVQLFRPASIRLLSGMQFHFGPQTEITPEPPIAAIDPKARRQSGNLDSQQLDRRSRRTTWNPPARAWNSCRRRPTSASAPPTSAAWSSASSRPRTWPACAIGRSRSRAAPTLTMPMRLVLVPRAGTVVWTADLDGDGSPEWILESAKVRAVFSAQDGGRWMEFTWKDTNTNFLPESGVFAQAGPVEVRQKGDALEFTGKGWKRTVTLNGNALTIEQSTPLPAETLATEKRGNTTLTVERPAPRSSFARSESSRAVLPGPCAPPSGNRCSAAKTSRISKNRCIREMNTPRLARNRECERDAARNRQLPNRGASRRPRSTARPAAYARIRCAARRRGIQEGWTTFGSARPA